MTDNRRKDHEGERLGPLLQVRITPGLDIALEEHMSTTRTKADVARQAMRLGLRVMRHAKGER